MHYAAVNFREESIKFSEYIKTHNEFNLLEDSEILKTCRACVIEENPLPTRTIQSLVYPLGVLSMDLMLNTAVQTTILNYIMQYEELIKTSTAYGGDSTTSD